MGMSIDELITFCEEEEHGCRVRCKRYDDASGYTRSKDKNVRTADAITEEVYGDFYKEISDTMRKYKKIQEIVKSWKSDTWTDGISYDCMVKISEVLEDGND